MKSIEKLCINFCLVFMLGCCLPSSAATVYPERPIKIVVPFAAGGPADFLARILGKELASRLNTSVIVENKPGAGGNIGTAIVARSAPDGYTLLLGYIGTLAINPYLYQKQSFNPVDDFAPISTIAANPLVLVARPGLGVSSVQELIARAKAGKNELTYGSGGVGSANHLAMALFGSAAGIKLVHVPYQGAAPATTALIAGQVDLMFDGVSASLAHIKSGALKALAVSTATRIAPLPNVKTMAESGIPGYDVSAWFGLLAPKDTPPAVLQRLEKATRESVMSATMSRQLAAAGFERQMRGQAEFGQFLKSELKKWSTVVRDSGAHAG